MYEKIEIEFTSPEHGWLEIKFRYKDFELNLDISDVPIDPMDGLCYSLIHILEGIKVPEIVIWHLEPYCYYLQLERVEKEFVCEILESDSFDSSRKKITKKIIGDFHSIILPLYRWVKRFDSYAFDTPHWERLDSKAINRLTVLIKENKKRHAR